MCKSIHFIGGSTNNEYVIIVPRTLDGSLSFITALTIIPSYLRTVMGKGIRGPETNVTSLS